MPELMTRSGGSFLGWPELSRWGYLSYSGLSVQQRERPFSSAACSLCRGSCRDRLSGHHQAKEVKLLVTTTSRDKWALLGIAVLVFDRGKIILVEETRDKPKIGKYAGMISIPMGAIDPGETAERAARREFGEETGLECSIELPIGFFEIQMAGRDRAGLIAFLGKLTGRSVPRERNGVKPPFRLSEVQFRDTDPFRMRPENFQIYAAWRLWDALLKAGKPTQWVKDMAKSLIPSAARQLMARE